MSTNPAYSPGAKLRNSWTGNIAEIVCRNEEGKLVLRFKDGHRIVRDDASIEQNWTPVKRPAVERYSGTVESFREAAGAKPNT